MQNKDPSTAAGDLVKIMTINLHNKYKFNTNNDFLANSSYNYIIMFSNHRHLSWCCFLEDQSTFLHQSHHYYHNCLHQCLQLVDQVFHDHHTIVAGEALLQFFSHDLLDQECQVRQCMIVSKYQLGSLPSWHGGIEDMSTFLAKDSWTLSAHTSLSSYDEQHLYL